MNAKMLRNRRSRPGYLLLEMLAATALVIILVGLGTQMLEAAAQQRRAMRHRQAAMQEAANLLERVAARPWPRLTSAEVARERLSDDARQTLPGGAVSIELAAEAGPPAGKRVLVTVSWRETAASESLAVRLAAWRYPEKPAPVAGKGGRP
jgi:type II secretory pathway component PulJ